MSAVLAIDAGQTGIKVRHLVDGTSEEWAAPGIRTDLPLLPQLVDVLALAGARGVRAEAVGVGVSGLTDRDADAGALLDAARALGARSVTLAHDSVTAYLGALGDERGVVTAAGTGVVTLAVGARDVARVDGWGNLMGDAGSGYWIGREALEAVMREVDGRGPATALTDAVRADFDDLESAYIELQAAPDRVQRIAAYARAVTALAADDRVAAAIVHRAARELALSAVTGLRRVGEDLAAAPEVRAVGGVFRSAHVAAGFEAAVRQVFPGAAIRVGTSDPLDGAARLLEVTEASALSRRLLRAGESRAA
ncbi:BadF/BadG/BcrA/BcrD ATPase family protein [Agromyces sp. G08B096]|uniref:BadF/BadG/BcrA/BcrD ATPase family protein n=1 Tax=Agromyces sp. G08B096 TaxID=3156399 RepID=A0AAU7W8L8_9MICO